MPATKRTNIQDSDPEKAKPKKRIVTEARREQNRIAQRAWRQRKRETQIAPPKKGTISGRVSKTLKPRLEASSTLVDLELEAGHGSSTSVSPSESSDVDFSVPVYEDATCSPSQPYTSSSDTFEQVSTSNQDLVLSSRHALADPKINTLQTTQTQTLLAVLNNAICLGFDIGGLMNCHQKQTSPFFRPIAPTDNPHDLAATILSPSTPVHLQPTMAQMLVPHHASLDLIPLPLLRDRVIMFSFAMPEVYNLWDLKLDIYVRHGLTLKIDRKDYQSWDRRAWEMKAWFGEKWGVTVCE